MIELAEKLDMEIKEQFSPADFETFLKVLDELIDTDMVSYHQSF